MSSAYRILDRKRRGATLESAEIAEVVAGATDGSWNDAQLAAFLMAAATRGLDAAETRSLTEAMLDSGERWSLAEEVPTLGDKHSTGGVGDKASLILAPVLASCDLPIAMLTGRGLGHTAGTADKLEGIPGLDLGLSRDQVLGLLAEHQMAIGMSTAEIAPADRKLYSLRDVTGTVASIPLIVASIVSKKVALGARGIAYDVKTGSGAFLENEDEAGVLAELLVETTRGLGLEASALVTDMSQPLGRWVGHDAEVMESMSCLRGSGPSDLEELVVELACEVGQLVEIDLAEIDARSALSSGRAYEKFVAWAEAQGAEASWLAEPVFDMAPEETPVLAGASGTLASVDTREIGLIVAHAGGGRRSPSDSIDRGISFRCDARIGDEITAGQPIGAVYLRAADPRVADRLAACFETGDLASAPPLVRRRV